MVHTYRRRYMDNQNNQNRNNNQDPNRNNRQGVSFVLLVTLQFKQDAFNAFFARRRLVPETRASRTVFYPDHYVVIFPAAETTAAATTRS